MNRESMSELQQQRFAALAASEHPAIPFADDDWQWFSGAVEELGLDPTIISYRQQWEAIYGHLIGCNRLINLTRITEPRHWLQDSLLDSLAALNDPRLQKLADGATVIDLGSGGGYPGLPLAVMRPNARWVLLDRSRKKPTSSSKPDR